MRIGLFTDTYPPFINGVSTSVNMLKKALEKKGHQVYVVTVNDSSIRYNYNEEERILRIPGVPTGIYDYRISRIYPLKMVNMIKNWNLDVIHSHTEFGIGIFARILAKQLNIPLVHTYHTMYEDYIYYITHGYFEKSSKKILEYLTKFYCDRTTSELIVPTVKTYHVFREKYKFERNIHIVPTGIEVDRFFKENVDTKKVNSLKRQLKITKNDTVVIFVGRLAEEKNVDFLLKAHKKIVKKNKSIKLLIVGDGPDKEKFEEIVKDEKINDNVIFTGKVAWEDIPYYYHLADIFTTASTTETQGLTVIEAMASNVVPVVIEDDAFQGTVVNKLNGYIFKTEKDYITDILKLVEDKKLVTSLGKQARIQSEHLSSTAYAESVLVVYERAIKNKSKYKYGVLSKITEFLGRSKDDSNIEQ